MCARAQKKRQFVVGLLIFFKHTHTRTLDKCMLHKRAGKMADCVHNCTRILAPFGHTTQLYAQFASYLHRKPETSAHL